jgi:hypothetical protein
MTCVVCMDAIKNMFYTSVDGRGQVDTYCYTCYHKAILDNYTGMKDGGGTKTNETKCECGSDRVGSPKHSNWCPKG